MNVGIYRKEKLLITDSMRLPIKLPVQYFVPTTLFLPFCVYVMQELVCFHLPIIPSFIIAGKAKCETNL